MKKVAKRIGSLVLGLLCNFYVLINALGADSGFTFQSVVAEIDGQKFTSEELEKGIAADLTNLQEQIYNLKRQRLDAMINDHLLFKEAERQNISVVELLDKEVTSKVTLVTEQEISAFHESHKAKINDGEQARQQIRQYLQNQSLASERDKYLKVLRAKATIVVNLQPPPPIRVQVSSNEGPVKGGDKAPVTIIKFEDYQCPFCKQAQATLAQIEARYKSQVKIVHRDFPIDAIHPLARRTAEAARCADEQERFWQYHDKVYATELNSDPTQLSVLAREVGLDVSVFDRCLASGKYKAAVQKDVEHGNEIGVMATPAFIINGRLAIGVQPLESFVRIIDEELADKLAKPTSP